MALTQIQTGMIQSTGTLPATTISSPAATSLTLQGAGTTGATIDTTGRVTFSAQPRFLAYRTTNQTGYNATSTGDAVVVYNATDYNVGSHYNTSTGKFTAPVAGTYIFYASVHTDSTSFNQSWLVVNGSRAPYMDACFSTSGNGIFSAVFLTYLAANDTVGYHPYNGSNSNQTILPTTNHTYFRGYLIS